MERVTRTVFMMLCVVAYAQPIRAPLAEYVVSSGFGYRDALAIKGGSTEPFHGGVDLVGPPGSSVLATGDGVVTEVWPPPGRWYKGHPVFGGMVMIVHSPTLVTLYGHMSAVLVREGERVTVGQAIGVQGSTGLSTAPHVHFAVLTAPVIPPSPPWRDATDRLMERAARRYLEREQKEMLR